MDYRVLGKTGLEVSTIGLGGIPIQKCTQAEADALIKACYANGINFIDTARGYTDSELKIGQAIKAYPDHFILATKSPEKTYAGMKAAIEISLKTLGVSTIHLYQCHFVKDLEQYGVITGEDGAYRALFEAKVEGKIKHIGITAHNKDVLSHALDSSLWDTVQFPYNFVETQGEAVFEKASQKNIGVIIMKPLAGGAIENAPLALKFILNNPNITSAIPGMNAPEQVVENTGVLNASIALTDAELKQIETFRERAGQNFCRRCGYCAPCPVGIDIPLMFTLEGYLTRYNLKDWAVSRYSQMTIKASDCIKCGACEPRCPYDLAIRDGLERVAETFA